VTYWVNVSESSGAGSPGLPQIKGVKWLLCIVYVLLNMFYGCSNRIVISYVVILIG